MSAFFFHDATEPLFGLYGPPCGDIDRNEGVLLCAPPGHEGQRTHWCLRLLGEQLMRTGFHVFRFDYSGHGDSWSTFEQATVARWLTDIQAAVRELADNSGTDKLSVVGLRLGATLAHAAVGDNHLHRLVLWDPVTDGRTYVERVRRMQTQQRRTWPTAPPCSPGAPFEDLLGFRYSAELIDQLTQLNLDTKAPGSTLSIKVRPEIDHADWENVAVYTEPVLLADARRAIVDLLQRTAP